MYVCMCVCMHASTYVFMYVCTYVFSVVQHVLILVECWHTFQIPSYRFDIFSFLKANWAEGQQMQAVFH
jgi:hypothetical protein